MSFYGCFQGNDGRMLGLGKFVDVNHDGKYIWTCSFLLLASQQDFRRPTKTLGHPKLWWFFVCHFLPLQDIPYLYVDPNLPHRNVANDFVLPLPLGVVDWKTLQANVSKVQNARSGGRVDVFEHDYTGNCSSGVVVVVVVFVLVLDRPSEHKLCNFFASVSFGPGFVGSAPIPLVSQAIPVLKLI